MQIRVGIAGQVVVDSQVDAFNVDTASEDIGSNTDALVELLEFLVPLDSMWMYLQLANGADKNDL